MPERPLRSCTPHSPSARRCTPWCGGARVRSRGLTLTLTLTLIGIVFPQADTQCITTQRQIWVLDNQMRLASGLALGVGLKLGLYTLLGWGVGSSKGMLTTESGLGMLTIGLGLGLGLGLGSRFRGGYFLTGHSTSYTTTVTICDYYSKDWLGSGEGAFIRVR